MGKAVAIESNLGFTTKEAAIYLRCSSSALELWRRRGEGPKFCRVGRRLIIYRLVDLETWVKS
jgi:hypothetical protein